MSRDALRSFLLKQLNKAVDEDVLFSLHMKATMMKVSDPIIFGHCVEAYFGDLIEEHGDALKAVGFNPNNGLSRFYSGTGFTRHRYQKSGDTKQSRKYFTRTAPTLPW